MVDFADDGVTPVHERDFFILLKGLGIFLFDEDGAAEDDLFSAESVFGVLGHVVGVRRGARADYSCSDSTGFGDSSIACCGGINEPGRGVSVLRCGYLMNGGLSIFEMTLTFC